MLLSVLLLIIRVWMSLAFLVLWFDKRKERYSWVVLLFSVFMLSSGVKGLGHSLKWELLSCWSGWIAAVSGMLIAIELPSIVYYFSSFASPSAMRIANQYLARTVTEVSEEKHIPVQDVFLRNKNED